MGSNGNELINISDNGAGGNGVSGSRTTPTMIPINQPTPGHLEELLANMPAAGQTAEQENLPSKGPWQPSYLNPRHIEIMRRILGGATYVQIAEQMGLHTQTIMLVATSKLFREKLAQMEEGLDNDVIKRAEEMSNEALDVIKTLMRNARSEALRKSCADRIMDTAGYSKIEKKLIGVVDGEAVIRELNKRKREAFERDSALRAIVEGEVLEVREANVV